MCFSAAASFGASAVLTGLGAASFGRTTSGPHRLLAAVPLLFAAQQAAEGVVWLTIGEAAHGPMHQMAVSAFLGIAYVVWPAFAPLALQLAERDRDRRRILRALTYFGAVAGAAAAVALPRWDPVASVAGHTIRYDYVGGDAQQNAMLLVVYLIPTIVPFFVSTTRLVRTIGVTLVIGLAVTVAMERDALTSVWCFFAAILSGLILIAVRREQPARTPLAAS